MEVMASGVWVEATDNWVEVGKHCGAEANLWYEEHGHKFAKLSSDRDGNVRTNHLSQLTNPIVYGLAYSRFISGASGDSFCNPSFNVLS